MSGKSHIVMNPQPESQDQIMDKQYIDPNSFGLEVINERQSNGVGPKQTSQQANMFTKNRINTQPSTKKLHNNNQAFMHDQMRNMGLSRLNMVTGNATEEVKGKAASAAGHSLKFHALTDWLICGRTFYDRERETRKRP